MAKVTELIEVLHTRGVVDDPSLNNKLDRSSRQLHSAYLEAKREKNNSIPPREKDLPEKGQKKGGTSMTST